MKGLVWKNPEGQAVVMVLLVVLILFVLSAALETITTGARGNIAGENYSIQALYAADAGIEKLTAKINNNPVWCYSLPSDRLVTVFNNQQLSENVYFTVSAQKGVQHEFGTAIFIESVGKYLDGSNNLLAQKTLNCEVVVYKAADFLSGFALLPEESSGLMFSGNGYFDAPLIYNGDLQLTGNIEVNSSKKIFTGGSFNAVSDGEDRPVYNAANVRQNYLYIPPFPDLSDNYYQARAAENGHVYYGDTTFSNLWLPVGEENTIMEVVPTYDGFYYVDGDIDISQNFNGQAVFFASGNIIVSGNLTPKVDADEDAPTPGVGNLTLVALGDINIKNVTVYANLVSGGSLIANDNTELNGAVCAKGASFPGCGSIKQYVADYMAPDDEFVPFCVKLVDWREKYPVFSDS
ncbi:hypothetical protein [Desulfotruncus alcoholivorax]|uniref:hypothetical protein n=1 Tax=Desulfotruncus alcoholivorax TaxID=265477 RepID=UPI00040FDE6E|nr:hypothetical protein [Desulfotruncus alcoholivorax]